MSHINLKMEHPAGGSHFQKNVGGQMIFLGAGVKTSEMFWNCIGVKMGVSGYLDLYSIYCIIFKKNHYKTVRKTNKQ